jgi:hypothetical protein
MTGTFGTSEGEHMNERVSCTTLRVSDYLEDLGIVGGIILKWI